MGESARRSLRRALRYLAHLGAGVAIVCLLVVSAGVGVILHLNLPAGRRVTARLLSELLSSTFRGTLTIGEIDRMTTRGVTARDVVVHDVYGNQVLTADTVRGRADVLEIVQDLLFDDSEKLTIVIRHARVENAEANIIPDPTTLEPTIAGAFALDRSEKPSEEPSTPGRQIRVWLPVVEIGRGYARGRIAKGPILETSITKVRGSVLTTPRGAAIDVQRFGMVVRGVGGTDAVGTGEVHIRAPGAVWGAFDGNLGQLPLSAFIRVDGSRLSITADIPRARPSEARALLPTWPLQQDVTAHLEASGELPVLETSGRFEIGETRLTARGPMRLSGGFALDLDASGQDVDLRAIWPDAPKTAINADSSVSIYDQRGRIVVDVNGTTQATVIEGLDVPPMDITGTLDRAIFNGKATVHERGMPLKVDFTVQPDGVVHLDALARRFRLQGAPRVARLTPARGTVEARVHARIEKNKLDAHVTADVSGFELGDLRLAQGRVVGHARGPLNRPRQLTISGSLVGKNGQTPDFAFEDVRARAQGPVLRPLVHAELRDGSGPSVEATGYVDTSSGEPNVEDMEVAVSRDGATLRGKVGKLEVSDGNIEIRDLSLVGAGELRGYIRIRPRLLEAKVEGEDLDLDTISRALGWPPGMFGGKLRINANVSAGSDVQRGEVFLALGNGSIAAIGGISLRMKATLEDERFDGELSAQLRDIGALGATWETKLAGHVLEESTWRDMIGSARINLDRLELANLVALLPPEARVSAISGTGFADLELNRRIAAALPTVIVRHAGTRGLQVERAAPDDDPDAEAETITGFDLRLSGEVSGETGESTGTTLIFYGNELLGSASGTARLDLARFIKQPGKLDEQLLETPLDATIVLNRRDVSTLPPWLRPPDLYGQIGGRLLVRGTPTAPSFQLSAEGTGLTMTTGREVVPVNVQLDAQYDKTSGAIGAGARVVHQGNVVAVADARGQMSWDAVFGEVPADTPRWTGSGQLTLRGLPLGVIAPLAGKRITGELWNTLRLERHDLLPHVRANIELRNLMIDEVALGNGRLTVSSNGESLRSNIRFEKSGGTFFAEALAAVRWDDVLPTLEDTRPVELTLKAKSFDAIVLSPVLSDVFSTLKGSIDAELHSRLMRSPETKEWTGRVLGTASMNGGLLKLRVLGLELMDVDFSARARDDHPYSLVTIDQFKARARSRRDNVTAKGEVRLRGLLVVGASAAISYEDFPLVIEGVPQAEGTGIARVTLVREPDEMRVVVHMDKLKAELPRTSERSVIALEGNDNVAVIQPLREPTDTGGGRGLPYRIIFDLGDVLIRRHDVSLRITGDPELLLDKKTELRGEVKLVPGGHLLLMGSKGFTVESGRVVFDTGEAGNPNVDLLASWQSPDGTTIYVRVRGRFKNPEVTLESTPPRTETELMTLLLGGRPDDSGEASDSQNQAAGAGLGLGASKLNELFKGSVLGEVPIEFRAGQTKDQRTSYVAAYRVSDTVWIEGIYRNREANTQDDPNPRPDVSTAVDYRFRKNWSLRSEIGTLGAGLELLWQYRY